MTRRITLTRELAFSSGRDAGNARMRRAERTRWDRGDWNHAARVTNRLLASVPFEQGGLDGIAAKCLGARREPARGLPLYAPQTRTGPIS